MINFDKEREAFEDAYSHCDFIKQVKYCGNHYETINGLTINKSAKKLAVSIANSSWSAWQKRAELAQAEITELKQKLERLESGEFVLVPREPTFAMTESGLMTLKKSESGYYIGSVEHIFKAMIEAVEKDHE